MLTIALLLAFAFARSGSTDFQGEKLRLQRTNKALLKALESARGEAEKDVGGLKKMNENCMNDWECESDNCDWRIYMCQPCGDWCAGKAVGTVSSRAGPREHSVGGIPYDELHRYDCFFDDQCSTSSICMFREHDRRSYCVKVDVSNAAAHSETSVGGVPAEWEHRYTCTSNSGCKAGSICAATSGGSFCVDVVTNCLGWSGCETSVGGVPAESEHMYQCTSNSGCKGGSICAATSGSSYCVDVVENCLGWSGCS